MVAFKVSVHTTDLVPRVRDRLRSTAPGSALRVTWQRQDGQRLVINLNSLKIRIVDGWLLCGLDAQTDQTGVQTLQFVFFLGRPNEADGGRAAGTVNAATAGAAQIAAVWGADLQRVIWDCVLDALEASLWQAGTQQSGQKLTLQGFHCTDNYLQVEVLAGEF